MPIWLGLQVAPTARVCLPLQLRQRVALAGDELRAFQDTRAADAAEVRRPTGPTPNL